MDIGLFLLTLLCIIGVQTTQQTPFCPFDAFDCECENGESYLLTRHELNMYEDAEISEMKCLVPDLNKICANYICPQLEKCNYRLSPINEEDCAMMEVQNYDEWGITEISYVGNKEYDYASEESTGAKASSIQNGEYYLTVDAQTFKESNDTEMTPAIRNEGYTVNHFLSSYFPRELTVPKGGFLHGHRLARQTESCHAPLDAFEHATVRCWEWPHWINCDVFCPFNSTLKGPEDRIKKINLNCRFSENIWKPYGFEAFSDCELYLNCKVKLIRPGYLKCFQPVQSPIYCEISCLHFEQYEATAMKKYKCVDRHFANILPHCAVLQDGVQLAKYKKKIHHKSNLLHTL